MVVVPLRRRLVVLAAVAIVPLALMAGIDLVVLQRQQNTQNERVGLELARYVANAVDSELRSSISVLETLSTTPTIDELDFEAFQDRALRVLATKKEWAAIVLTDPNKMPLMDTRYGIRSAKSVILDEVSFERVVRTGEPAIGSLVQYTPGVWLFPVRVPVIRSGKVRDVLTALVKPEAIRDVLTRQPVPQDWVISIIDSRGLRVARSRAHEENLGGRLSQTVQQVVDKGGTEGFGIAYTLEGERIFTPYSRVLSSDWMAVLGLPTALVDAAAYRSLFVYGGGVLLSILIGTIGAFWIARSITRPISDLLDAAEMLGRRVSPPLPDTSIQEIRSVGAALKNAADELAKGESEREDLLRKERHAREEAEKADRAKDEFMAVLSHELRTPLNAVYGWARMLQAGELRDEALQARAKDAIVRNANAQMQLIDDLLDLSRITSGKMRLDVRSVDLASVLQASLDAVRPAAEAKNISTHLSLDPGLAPISGDAARLQQVIWNLLMNAIKFTPERGTVGLQLRRVDGHAQIVVSDTGCGIDANILPYVFERFRQGDSSSTRTHRGLGLGLALVKHLVELHGGSVSAQSEGKDCGATFIVDLPVGAAGTAKESSTSAPRSSVSSDTLVTEVTRMNGVRVLVVDDDADALALAKTILARSGAEVLTCANAPDALRLLREIRPDVLVSDIEMPGEDGYALIQKVRALSPEQGGRTPAIALTAYNRPQDRTRAIAAGFDMHIPKPIDPGELTAIISDVVSQSRSVDAL